MSNNSEIDLISKTVDDVELLNILGLNKAEDPIVILDWDLPELSDEEIDDDKESVITVTQKRKYMDEEDNLFNQLHFVEVPFLTTKKRKFIEKEEEINLTDFENITTNLKDDMQLVLDLISS